MSLGEPLVRGRITNSRSSAASVRSTVSTRAFAEVSISETVRWRTPTLAPASLELGRVHGAAVECSSQVAGEFGQWSPWSLYDLGAFPPKCVLGGFSPKNPPSRRHRSPPSNRPANRNRQRLCQTGLGNPFFSFHWY